MRRGSFVGLLVVSLFASACGDVPGAPLAPSGPPAPIAPTKLTLASGIELPVGGGTASIRIETSPAAGVRVQLVASGGSLNVAEVTTDETGHATATWTGTETATITGATGALEGAVVITVRLPVVVPPDVPPVRRPPPPPAEPTPPTAPESRPMVVLFPTEPSVPVGASQPYNVGVSGLREGETVLYYTWQFEDEATATTTVPMRSYIYRTHGIKQPTVSVHTSTGRTGTASASIIVTSTLR